LKDFKERNKERFIFLYFGTAQKRRGYDLLLKMAVEEDACFIHCGLNDQNEKYELDVNALKKDLEKKGRLLETDQYISDPACIESFFRSATHLVLPYQNFWGSSGVMLQALAYGIPVLVPESGIMGYRVKKHKLGLTYNGGINSLTEQFARFKKLPVENFKTAISGYMRYQTSEQLKKVLINIFKGSNQVIEHP
jgi:glycosyltransferase involved in cell wall biosynthesis